jgi:hypothetical protein
MNYITVLDFEAGRVFQYDMKENYYSFEKDAEVFLTANGHNLSNIEWMVHEKPQVITK